MNASNGLSEEQRARIEENKRRAEAKRQQRLLGRAQPTGQNAGASPSYRPPEVPSWSTDSSASRVHSAQPSSGTYINTTAGKQVVHTAQPSSGTYTAALSAAGKQLWTGSGVKTNQKNTDSSGASTSNTTHHKTGFTQSGNTGAWQNKAKQPQGLQQTNEIGKKQFYGAGQSVLKGSCILISKDRFEVNIGYSQTLVDVFKTIGSRVYDAATRKWSFNIQDHDALVKAVSGLRPGVQVEPLPKVILQVFGSTEKADSPFIPQADLSQVDSVLVNSLMPFQREGVNFGVHLKGRVLIADDMGLGKTLQAICLACVYRNKWPLLVVTPSSVRFDWAQQFRRWVPSLDPERIHVAVTGRGNPASGLVNIISYDLLSRKAKDLTAARFRVIIMDESHFLKNHKTVRTKSALPLLQSAQHVVLLSGTPALSRPVELYTQIMAICPRMFKFHDFGIRYCEGKEQRWGWDFSGSCNMGELQLLLEQKIMIRRLKQDVLSQLPAKRRQMVILDPVSVASSRTLVQASKVMEKKLTGMERRGALLQYFNETCKVKVSAVRSYVSDMLAAEKKFIIFAHHQEMMDSIEDTVANEAVQYIRIDGRTTAEQRHFFCKKFQTKEECKVAVLSITAANAGLNLAAASTVVFAELFWNPGILVQAEDRAHRLGQQDSVLVYYLVAQNTADDYIWPLVQNKLQVLGKAGLAGDDFANTDTAHVRDPKQKRILDMFEESFLEETDPERQTDGTAAAQGERQEATVNMGTSSPRKRKAPGTPSKRQKLSPGKGQTGINQFFPVDSIQTARSPKKARLDPGSTGGQACPPRSVGRLDLQQSVRQGVQAAGQDADAVCDVPLSEWDTEMGEEALAAMTADVDWDEDLEAEPGPEELTS